MITTTSASASILMMFSLLSTSTLGQSLLPEDIVLELPPNPVQVGRNWSFTFELPSNDTEVLKQRSFWATQVYVTSSNGTDMVSVPGVSSRPGTYNLGNSTLDSPWSNTTNEFVTLPDTQGPICGSALVDHDKASFGWESATWPADNYTLHVRHNIWTGANGVRVVGKDDEAMYCIDPPFANHSVATQARVAMTESAGSGNATASVTTTVAIPTSTDAYGRQQAVVPVPSVTGGADRLFMAGSGVVATCGLLIASILYTLC